MYLFGLFNFILNKNIIVFAFLLFIVIKLTMDIKKKHARSLMNFIILILFGSLCKQQDLDKPEVLSKNLPFKQVY